MMSMQAKGGGWYVGYRSFGRRRAVVRTRFSRCGGAQDDIFGGRGGGAVGVREGGLRAVVAASLLASSKTKTNNKRSGARGSTGSLFLCRRINSADAQEFPWRRFASRWSSMRTNHMQTRKITKVTRAKTPMWKKSLPIASRRLG